MYIKLSPRQYLTKACLCVIPSLLLYFCLDCNDTFFYYPTRRLYVAPERLNISYQEFYLKGADNNSVHAWLFPPQEAKNQGKRERQLTKPHATIVQFHGNAQNMSSHYTSLLWLTKHGFELFSFDYRGYGRSDGKVDTGKILADVQLVLKFLQERSRKNQVPLIIYGQSLGGILAVRSLGELKDRSFISAIVIEGSFSSYRSIAKQAVDRVCIPLGYLSYLIISDRYAVDDVLPQLTPIYAIVVHGTADHVVPFTNGKEIFNLAREPKFFLEISEAEHLDWHHVKDYDQERRTLVRLLKDSLVTTSSRTLSK